MSAPSRSGPEDDGVTRRAFLTAGAAACLSAAPGVAADNDAAATTRQASGVKVGEVTDASAIIWTRLTAAGSRNQGGEKVVGKFRKKADQPAIADPGKLHGACPGAPGRIRVRYSAKPDLADAKTTGWVSVTEKTDFAHSFAIAGLPSDTLIHYAVETAEPGETGKMHGALAGSFRTAPPPDRKTPVMFAVVTCQMYADLDHADGFHMYPAMSGLDPRFVVFTGDNVYYDSELPRAESPALARYHWQRMVSLPRHVELLRKVASYWEKDDHDTVIDDCWPGRRLGQLTFADGQRIFREQVPMGERTYRTVRWGKFLQVWFTEGRDFRSANTDPDGPAKTIWGKEQKEWLFRTLQASDATWKVLVSPTPLVGPDRKTKNDNHSNQGFRHEGDEARRWFQANVPRNFFVACGDRHWQYHSVHPATGLHEFSVGPASDIHASGTPGEDRTYHRFHRVKGGFLTITAGEQSILFRHHDVHGKVVYQYEARA
jgi:alkaline phosphatase D